MAKEDRGSFISRIGTFFILLGLLGVILFVTSDIAKKTNFTYLLMSLVLFICAWFLKRSSAAPAQADTRFQGVRQWQKNRRDAKAKSEKDRKK